MEPHRFFHFKLDAFFASVEVLSNPSLRGRPLIVGGMPQDHGVVASASYEARRFGVTSGMPLSEAATLCPRGIFVPCRPGPYVHFSKRILELLRRQSPRVEWFGIDQFIVEGNAVCHDRTKAWRWARGVQKQVLDQYHLTASVGIGSSKRIAKMASRLQQPHGVTFLSRRDYREVFWSKPLERLPGIEERTVQILRGFGLATIGDLARTEPRSLSPYFGANAEALVVCAKGDETEQTHPETEVEQRRPIVYEQRFERELADRNEIDLGLRELAAQIVAALRRGGKRARVVRLTLDWSDFSSTSSRTSLPRPTDCVDDLHRQLRALFWRFDLGGGIRRLAVSVAGLSSADESSAIGVRRLLFSTVSGRKSRPVVEPRDVSQDSDDDLRRHVRI